MRTTYTAEDGTTFDSEDDCRQYEELSSAFSVVFDRMDTHELTLGFSEGFFFRIREVFVDPADLMKHRQGFIRMAELLTGRLQIPPQG